MENFSNNFLISMPHLNDSVFGESLIYICDHNKFGAMGIIINKPLPLENSQNILIEIGLEQLKPNIELYFGGPVQVETGMILHDCAYQTEGTINISKTIALSSHTNIIDDIKNGNGPNKFKFALGYSGWGEGQLEGEVENGDWLLVPSNYDLIFNTPNPEILIKLKSLIDIDVNHLSGGLSGLS
tara:strand:+ start:56 stop:607 length:552 start_codon:yes stop_codon:yes gene_type:complete